MKKKLVKISALASPHWVTFEPYLQKYFDAEFYFYEPASRVRSFWEMPLGEHCHVINPWFKWKCRYCTFKVLEILRKEKPDSLLMSGFSVPSNYFAYLWAKRHGVRVVIFTERSRISSKGTLRPYDWKWKLLHWLYRKVDCVMTISADIVPQFRDTFRFGDKVIAGRYPSDIDRYYSHPIRTAKDAYTIIYANRESDNYNPLAAVRIFAKVLKKYPKTKLKMNSAGELRPQVEALVKELRLSQSVEFLDNIKTWKELGDVYASSDILLFPAKFSNGNYTINECLVSGMGCVISDRILGGTPKVMKEKGIGFVLPLDEDLFAEKVCWYIEHPEEFARCARIGREINYNSTHIATAKLYKELLDGDGEKCA